jgi:membrane protease YdiL (CAAX protease family)
VKHPNVVGTPHLPLTVLSTYIAVTWALAWLAASPVVFTDAADRGELPLQTYYNLVMLTPLIGAIVAYLVERRHVRARRREATDSTDGVHVPTKPQPLVDALGITPLRPLGRLIGWSVLSLMLLFGFSVAALGVGALLGVYPLDPSLPIFVRELETRLGHDATEFIAPGLAVEIGQIFLGALVLVFIHAAQEMGWRGYLFPRLQVRWGPGWAVLITGIASGLWYAPLLYLGFFYNLGNIFESLALMIGYSIVIGGVLAWLRTRSGSIWPAAFGQSMITSAAVLHFWFAAEGVTVDLRAATLQGWSGWILPAILLGILLIVSRKAFAPAR